MRISYRNSGMILGLLCLILIGCSNPANSDSNPADPDSSPADSDSNPADPDSSPADPFDWSSDKTTSTIDGVSFIFLRSPSELESSRLAGGKFPSGRKTGETHKTVVDIPKQFWAQETEVTWELWITVYNWAITQGYAFAHSGRQGGDYSTGPVGNNQHPVGSISWRDGILFCNAITEWYNAKTGDTLVPVYYTDSAYTIPVRSATKEATVDGTSGSVDNPYVNPTADGFRLPEVLEWECAARYIGTNNPGYGIDPAGSGLFWMPGDYASGASEDSSNADATAAVAWYVLNSESKTHPVAQKESNQFGLFDMSGNIWELCLEEMPSYGGAPPNPYRSMRGGSWYSYSPYAYGDEVRVGYGGSGVRTYDPNIPVGIRLFKNAF